MGLLSLKTKKQVAIDQQDYINDKLNELKELKQEKALIQQKLDFVERELIEIHFNSHPEFIYHDKLIARAKPNVYYKTDLERLQSDHPDIDVSEYKFKQLGKLKIDFI